MKRLSLQWRVALMTFLLLTLACVTMKTLLCSSGHAYMDSIGSYVLHYAEEEPQAVRVDIPEEQWKDMSERFSGEFVVELTGAKHSFCMRGWYIALAVTVLGGAVAYFVSGRALKPLKRFTAKAERVQLQSLTEITLSEDEAAEFSRLSRAINQMLQRLNQAFDAQRQFVGNAAHELRTPLALMQARLDLYISTDHGDSCPETAETIAMMREQTERLSRMVRTLLDMSDLKSVPRNDQIQLVPMIEEVLADLSPLAEKSGVTLSQSGEGLWITGSDVLVYRAIFNLVENGVKYNRADGSVCVAASRRGQEAVIEVKDTGYGIPEDFRESVFQPFFRVDKSRSREKGGVGLGLSLVWEIARLHGGDVRVRESGENGTAIELTLPVSAEERGNIMMRRCGKTRYESVNSIICDCS